MKTRLLLSMLPLIFPGVSWAESAREATPEPETPVRTTLPAAPERMRIGLVLSGGGAKGVAHIGVIQALEENDIPIDYITGTSAGAIFGGLYAAGYSPQEMLDLLVSKGFGYWSTGQIDPSLRYYFMANEPSPAMFNIPIVTKRDSVENARSAVPASLISPIPMSFAFMELFAPYTAQCGGDFNNLFVPFRCVASDVAARHKIVMRGGDFGDAIRSSMSFPIVFQPTRVGKMLLYDGGIYDNFPVDVMNADFGPDFILGIDVSTIEKGPQTSLMDQLDNLVIQSNDYYLDPATGIKIRFDLNRFGLLDFQQAREIYRIGYETTMAMMDSIKSRIPVRVPHQTVEARRAAFKSRTPELRFNNVDVTGGTPAQNHYIRYMFTDDKPDTFGIDQARTAFYRAVSNNKLRELSPHALYNDTTDLFNLKLHASVKNNLTAGVGGYITTSTNSYVFLNAGFSNYSFRSLSANISGWLGQSYQSAMLKGRFNLPTTIGTALDLQLVGTHEEYFHGDKMFFTRHDPSFVHHREVFGRLMFSMAAGTLSKLEIGVGAASVHYSFFQSLDNEEFNPYRDRNRFLLSQAFVKWEENTLNDINYPVRGGLYRVTGMAVGGNYKQKSGPDGIVSDREEPRWLQLEAVTKTFMPLCRHFSLGVESDIMLSTRKLLRDYNISIVAAPGFYPTAASYNHFDPEFRANSFLSLGLVPVYRYNDSFSARLSLNGFVPIRPIECSAVGRAVRQGAWIKNPRFFGELALNYHLPFGNVTAYCSYSSSTGNDWSVGLSFGVFVLSPQFLR